MQTALRLQSEGKPSLHHELKLKRRVQREHSQRVLERSRSARSSCSSRSSQSDDSNIQEIEKMEKEKDRQDLEIETIIQVGAEGINGGTINPNVKLSFDFALSVSCSMHVNWKTDEGRQKKEKGRNRGRCRWSWRDSLKRPRR